MMRSIRKKNEVSKVYNTRKVVSESTPDISFTDKPVERCTNPFVKIHLQMIANK